MKKDWSYAYYGYRPVPGYVVRVKIPRGGSLLDAYDAEEWHRKEQKWVPNDGALEDVKYDHVNTTNYTKQEAMERVGENLK